MPPDAQPHIRAGLVGVGSMGLGIATNLIEAGVELLVHDTDPARIATARAVGATSGDPEALAQEPTVILSLPGPAQVSAVCETLLPRMAPGSTLVNTSTVGVRLTRDLAQAAEARRVDFVDAPVTGAADGARQGQLVFMVGASSHALERVRPVLAAASRSIHHVGPPGAGTAAKLLTNRLWFIHVVALADTLALGALEGIDPSRLSGLIRESAGGSWVADHDLDKILADDDDESFSLALCTKDLRLIRELAGSHAYQDPLVEVAHHRFDEAERRFGASSGELSVARLAETRAGISIRATPASRTPDDSGEASSPAAAERPLS